MTTPPGSVPRHGPRQPDHRQQPPQWQPERRPAEPAQRPAPTPAPTPTPPAAPPRDATWVFVLRIATYVLTSLASLVFLAMVLYGYLALQDLRSSLSGSPLFGGGSFSAPESPTSGLPEICLTQPTDPSCANY